MVQAAQQGWRGSCLSSLKSPPDVASDVAIIPRKGAFPQRKDENTRGFKNNLSNRFRKKSLSTMGGLPGVLPSSSCIFFFHQQLRLA